jgi:hypothetical protein
MRKFICKTAFFVTPFLGLYIITFLFYTTDAGDLLRVGYIPCTDKKYRQNFTSFDNDIKFSKLSEAKEKEYKFLTIGDSFSEKGGKGYQNTLANDFSVLHIDRFISTNQIQRLIDLSNGNFFDNYHIQYVILQVVERNLTDDIKKIDCCTKIDVHQIDSMIMNHKTQQDKYQYNFFSHETLGFPLYALKYFINKNYLSNEQVYNVEINTKSLFSNNLNKLLFFCEDLNKTEQNNLLENAHELNNVLNKLSKKLKEKNITLIFLPSPDKYDLYHDYIVNKQNLTKPVFFDNFRKLCKEYIYIDSKEILSKELKNKKDIYYFDDTHWSPVAAELIAQKIKEEITKNE